MKTTIIDAHAHLWLRQDTTVDGQVIRTTHQGRSLFMGQEVQMLPPFMIDGVNSAEVFLSNMDYAQVGAAVIVQEVIDGNQNDYLSQVKSCYPDRFFCMAMAQTVEEVQAAQRQGLQGVAIPAHRLHGSLLELMPMLTYMEHEGLVLSICLADDPIQIGEMSEVIQSLPRLKVAIGHFGMVTTPSWEQQVKLCLQGPNVYLESGGITWLYNSEFYPYPTAMQSIRQAADWVGMDRLMWGSDYPRTITAITYRMSYDFITKSPLLTEAEKEAFLGGNAQRFYGFSELPDLPYIKNMSE